MKCIPVSRIVLGCAGYRPSLKFERVMRELEAGEAQKRDCGTPDAGSADSFTRATAAKAEGCGGSVPPLVGVRAGARQGDDHDKS
jgi:hypothetical protein